MTGSPDFIWAKTTLGNTDEGYWEARPILPNMPENQGITYVRRAPAVLAELPEVKAMVAAALEGAEQDVSAALLAVCRKDPMPSVGRVELAVKAAIRALIRADAKAALDAHVAAGVRLALEWLDTKIGDERGDPGEPGEWGSGWNAALWFSRKTIRALIEETPK